MSLETELYARLSGYSGMSALVSTRIYPVVAPQNAALPYITYRRLGAVRESAMGSDTGDVGARFQIDIYAADYSGVAGAHGVRDLVRAALKRYRGGVIADIFLENEMDDEETDPMEARVIMDFIIWYKE